MVKNEQMVTEVYQWVSTNFGWDGGYAPGQQAVIQHAVVIEGTEEHPTATVKLVMVNLEENGFYQCGTYYFDFNDLYSDLPTWLNDYEEADLMAQSFKEALDWVADQV